MGNKKIIRYVAVVLTLTTVLFTGCSDVNETDSNAVSEQIEETLEVFESVEEVTLLTEAVNEETENTQTEEEITSETESETTTEAPTEPPTNPVTGCTIENIMSFATIEADVCLTGLGTGYHAKLVICTPTSAVSFGIQFDEWATAPYTGKTMALIENIGSNNPGGQSYYRPSNVELQLGQPYHMMLTLNRDGSGSVYLDGNKIGDYYNAGLANQSIVYLRVEGSGRKDGDAVYATFNNIRLKTDGKYQSNKSWGTHEFKQNATINSTANGSSSVYVAGFVSGLSENEDWDSRYNDVSGIIQFIQ